MEAFSPEYYRLLKLSQEFSASIQVHLKNINKMNLSVLRAQQIFVAFRFVRGSETFCSIVSLCEKFLWVDAFSLVRVLVENNISLQWMSESLEERFDLFQDELSVKIRDILNLLEGKTPPPHLKERVLQREKEIAKEFRAVQKKYDKAGKKRKRNPNYRPNPVPNIASMAEEIGKKEMYDTAYREASSAIHNDLWGYLRHTQQNDETGVNFFPKVEVGTQALSLGLTSYIGIILSSQEEFEIFDVDEVKKWVSKINSTIP
jgi:hypothetical protein